ncbi:hypothetical protein Tco_1335683, partial [Tanacetum coccineum]
MDEVKVLPKKICLGIDVEPDEWIKDSGCTKHMTANQKLFSTYMAYTGGDVIFGSNLHGNIIDKDTKLTKDEECEFMDSTKYMDMIDDLKTSHLGPVKRIFRYIKGITHLGLWYPKKTRIETVVYADYDHAGDYVDRKSTSVIMEYLVKISKKAHILELKQRNMKITVLTSYTPYPSRKIRSIETEFPAIFLNDALTFEVALSCEPV